MTPGRVLFATALLLVAAGVGARLWSARLEADGLELAARSRDAAAAFTQSLVGEHHDAELALLDQRRERMVHAAWWGRGGMLAFGVAVLALLAAWVGHEIRDFREVASEVERSASTDGSPPSDSSGGARTTG